MYTIYDYLNYYKDEDFKDLPWNMMDNLLCSILSYVPLKSFNKLKFKDFINNIKENPIKETDLMRPMVLKVIDIIKNSKRYKEIYFENFINLRDSNTQFGVLTIKIDNIKIISFKGTDGSTIGWLENFRLGYIYPTNTHKLAIDYVKNNITVFDNEVYILGHSKGGNLAMVSAMEQNSSKFSKIKQVINYDGPGFRKCEFESNKYKKLLPKLVNIIPTGSYIGTLLYNKNYHVVTSNSHAINEHYPTSWNIFGTKFITGKLSIASKELNKRTTLEFSKLDEDKVKEIFEYIFKVFQDRISDKGKISFKELIEVFKSMHNMDKELSSYISTILKTLMSLSNIQNKTSK